MGYDFSQGVEEIDLDLPRFREINNVREMIGLGFVYSRFIRLTTAKSPEEIQQKAENCFYPEIFFEGMNPDKPIEIKKTEANCFCFECAAMTFKLEPQGDVLQITPNQVLQKTHEVIPDSEESQAKLRLWLSTIKSSMID